MLLYDIGCFTHKAEVGWVSQAVFTEGSSCSCIQNTARVGGWEEPSNWEQESWGFGTSLAVSYFLHMVVPAYQTSHRRRQQEAPGMSSQGNSKSSIPFKSNSDGTQHLSTLLLRVGVIKRPGTLQTCLIHSIALPFLPGVFGKVTYVFLHPEVNCAVLKVSVFSGKIFIRVECEYEFRGKVIETNTKLL